MKTVKTNVLQTKRLGLLALLIISCLALPACRYKAPSTDDEEMTERKPRPPITVFAVIKNASYKRGEGDWTQISKKKPVQFGDVIRTDEDGRLSLHFPDHSLARINGPGAVTIEAPVDMLPAKINILDGEVWGKLDKGKRATFLISTPAAVVDANGAEVAVSHRKGKTLVRVITGPVLVTNSLGSQTVDSNHSLTVTEGEAPSPPASSNPEAVRAELDKWQSALVELESDNIPENKPEGKDL